MGRPNRRLVVAAVLLLTAAAVIGGVSGLVPIERPPRRAGHPGGIVDELTPVNFDRVVLNPKANVFVKFYAPWCGHCQAFAPKWEALAKMVDDRGLDLQIVALDASRYSEKAAEHNVRMYPTITLFPKHHKGGLPYTAARDPESMLTFALQHMDK